MFLSGVPFVAKRGEFLFCDIDYDDDIAMAARVIISVKLFCDPDPGFPWTTVVKNFNQNANLIWWFQKKYVSLHIEKEIQNFYQFNFQKIMENNYEEILINLRYKMYEDIKEIIRKKGYAVKESSELDIYDEEESGMLAVKGNGENIVWSLILTPDDHIYVYTNLKTFIINELYTDDMLEILGTIENMTPEQAESCKAWVEK